MVQEIRKMIFSSGELLSAFDAYGRTNSKFLPGGKLIACAPVDEDGVRLKIAMQYGSSTHEVEFVYRGVDVLRPLVLFCIENNVMLPRDGKKGFSIVEGQAVLTIELNLDLDLSATTLPMLSEHIRLIKTDKVSPKPEKIGAPAHNS
jgi:hypothetical protein